MTDSDTKVTFAQFQEPGLKDDTYTVKARVSLSTSLPDATPFQDVTKVLRVGTTVESIPADSVVSVSPAGGTSGDFTGQLPHVVIAHPSLPWQKGMKGGSLRTPWLGILLVTDAELKRSPTAISSDKKTLTLGTGFFQSIAPTLDELDYLAHVRKIDTISTVDGTDVQTTYALVIGNRLPPDGSGSNVFFVALHDHADNLPTGKGAKEEAASASGTVDIPILFSWRFFTQADASTFGQVVSRVDHSPPTLCLPNSDPNGPLTMGYVPLPHALRVGGQTVSWYRGPLVPYGSKRQLPVVPIRCADAVTAYDPSTGMMDVSQSSAWTIGRLLALNSGSFALAVYNWKRATQRATIDKVIFELDTGVPPSNQRPALARRAAAEMRLATFLPEALALLGGHPTTLDQKTLSAKIASVPTVAKPARSREQRAAYLRDIMTDPRKIAATHSFDQHDRAPLRADATTVADPSLDENLAQIYAWLGDLLLLKGVPFFYLVPDARMLPTESIRFFSIDQSWMTSLVDGAVSIGRVTEADVSHDEAAHAMVMRGATKVAARSRPLRNAATDDDPALLARPACGFFLRSSAVTRWPGLSVEAARLSDPTRSAKIVRMEAFGTILICLFDQEIIEVKLHPPTQGVHFGFDEDPDAPPKQRPVPLVKKRRRLQGDETNPIGSELDDSELHGALYRDRGLGVLDIRGLATFFAKSFGMTTAAFTSAEFALQMIAGVDEVVFDCQGMMRSVIHDAQPSS